VFTRWDIHGAECAFNLIALFLSGVPRHATSVLFGFNPTCKYFSLKFEDPADINIFFAFFFKRQSR
jgi:hypothetical protein